MQKLNKLTNEQINNLIYSDLNPDTTVEVKPNTTFLKVWEQYVDNYCGDFQVMHEALKNGLNTPELRRLFIQNLVVICDNKFGNGEVEPSDVFDVVEMTAMMLIDIEPVDYAKAYLLAKGLADS
jgi:hypothetical protein